MKKFTNGFNSWAETYFEIVSAITHECRKESFESPIVEEKYESTGTGGMYELAESLTNKFEQEHKGRMWDGEFLDEIEEFIDKELYPEGAPDTFIYLILGSDSSFLYNKFSIEDFCYGVKESNRNVELIKWNKQGDPLTLVGQLDGWRSWEAIPKDHYNKIKKSLKQ